MKTYDERKRTIIRKARRRKIVRVSLKTVTALACMLVLIIGILHIPYGSMEAGTPITRPNFLTGSTGNTQPTNWPTHIVPTIVATGTIPTPRPMVSLCIWGLDGHTLSTIEEQIMELNASEVLDIQIFPEIQVKTADEILLCLQEEPPENLPDIVCIDQTQVKSLASLDLLTPFYDENADAIAGKNDALSVNSAAYGSHIYAAPLYYYRDGYVLYYDRSIISDEDATSLEAIIAACEAAGKKFCFDLENPYYQAAFYLSGGWYSHWTQDKSGKYISYRDNLNSQAGEIGLRGMCKLLRSVCYISPKIDGLYTSDSLDDAYSSSAAIVSGLWEDELIKNYMQDMGVAKLPSFTVDECTYQLGSFGNMMMLAVPRKGGEDASGFAIDMAMYLSCETSQMDHWYNWGYVPTNHSAQAEVRSATGVDAFLAQSHFAVPMFNFPQRWWDWTVNVPSLLLSGLTTDEILIRYDEFIGGLVSQNGSRWCVVGNIEGSFYNQEFTMIAGEDQTFVTDRALFFDENSEFMIMHVDLDAKFKEFFGPDGINQSKPFKPGLSGYYYVVFDQRAGTCSYIVSTELD